MLSVRNISNRLLSAWSKLWRSVEAGSVIAFQSEEMDVQKKKQDDLFLMFVRWAEIFLKMLLVTDLTSTELQPGRLIILKTKC